MSCTLSLPNVTNLTLNVTVKQTQRTMPENNRQDRVRQWHKTMNRIVGRWRESAQDSRQVAYERASVKAPGDKLSGFSGDGMNLGKKYMHRPF